MLLPPKITNNKKNTQLSIILNSYREVLSITSFGRLSYNYKLLNTYFFLNFFHLKTVREQANCVYKDMLGLVYMWRQIRGYPTGGATTHTNAKMSRKNKLLFSFRLNQFKVLFGAKKRNIYPTLIKAEYNNRLWYNIWLGEWVQASFFIAKILKNEKKHNLFNPAILAGNQTNGYIRIGKAAKIGKAKKLTKVFTIGVPLFFTRFIYYEKMPNSFFPRLVLRDEVNKKMGKKLRKKNR